MGRPAIDLTGQKFGNLKVIRRSGSDPRYRSTWRCLCFLCKSKFDVRSYALRGGLLTSCGCDRKERLRKAATKHGGNKTPEHHVWRSMLYRCRTETSANYDDYGGRGIDFDPRWRSFRAFLRDVGFRPSSEHSLDRIDNERGYWPDNVRWATKRQQVRNRRDNLRLTVGGVTRLVVEWSELMGVPVETIKTRIRAGYPPEQCVEAKSWRTEPRSSWPGQR